MSLVAVRVRELAEGGEDGGRVLLGDARGLRRVSGRVRARNGGRRGQTRRGRPSSAPRAQVSGATLPLNYRAVLVSGVALISTQVLGRPSAPSIPPPSRSGAQSTSRSSRSIADSRISRDRSPILRCGSALLSPCRRRRGPNLLIMFLIYCSRRKFTILIFQNAMPARIVTSAFPLCDVRLGGIDAMWSLASKFRSRGG